MINFDVKLSKSSLGVNEKLRVEFSINKDGNNFSSPDFKNFKVVGGPNQSVKNSWINGVRSYNKTYTYILSPIKGGTYNIGQAKIEVLGKVYKTLPIEVKIVTDPKGYINFFYSQIDTNNIYVFVDTFFGSYYKMIYSYFGIDKLNNISKSIFSKLIILFIGLSIIFTLFILSTTSLYLEISGWFMLPLFLPIFLLISTLTNIFLLKITHFFQVFFKFIIYGLDKE